MATKIRKNIKTCKAFWPASADFVNSATVFVNSATPRGEGPPGPPNLHFLSVPPERCSFIKRAKRVVHFLRPSGSKRAQLERF